MTHEQTEHQLDKVQTAGGNTPDNFDDIRALAFGPQAHQVGHGQLNQGHQSDVAKAVVGLVAMDIANSHETPEERQSSISQADQTAGDVNNLSEVSDADVGRLNAAMPTGNSVSESYARARVEGAKARAEQMLAVQNTARSMGNSDFHVQGDFSSPEEYRAAMAKKQQESSSDKTI